MAKPNIHEYRIDSHWDGLIKVYFLTSKYISWWKGYDLISEELIFTGRDYDLVEQSIRQHVSNLKGTSLRYSSYRDQYGHKMDQHPPI